MARKKSPTLTDSELRLMRIIWERGPSSVGDVMEALPDDEPLAYSSVLTTLRILEQKGYLTHFKSGRAYIYQAEVGKAAASRRALDFVMDRFFDNSAGQLVQNILDDGDITEEQLKQLRALLDAHSSGEDKS